MSDASFTLTITTIQATVIAIGIIGNVLSIIVFSRKAFRNNSISTYCTALSIVECFTLIRLITDIYSLAYNIYLPDQSDALCKFTYSVVTYLGSIQPWIMVAFSVDKLLGIRVNSIAIIKKKWFQWTVVAGIVLLNIVLYIYFPILIRLNEIFPGYIICDLSTIGFFQIFMIVNILEMCLIPFIVMTITSILTIRMLIKSRNSVESIGNMSKNRKSRDYKYAISSLALNIIFIILRLPGSVFYILSAFYSYFDLYFYNVSSFLFFLNSSLSLFIHLATNSVFRREMFVLFKLAKRNVVTVVSSSIRHINRPILSRNQISSTN